MAGHRERIHAARLGKDAALLGLAILDFGSSLTEHGRQLRRPELPAANGRHMNAGGDRGLTQRGTGLAGCQHARDDIRTITPWIEMGVRAHFIFSVSANAQ
jgi:hypothetical protein